MNKLDNIAEKINETNYQLDNKMKNSILKKVKRQQHKHKGVTILQSVAALLVISILSFTFIPDNPVNAFMKQVFSFIPGVGVVVDGEQGQVEKVLNGVIRYERDNHFVDIYTAYIKGDYLQIAVQTDLYTIEKGSDDSFNDLLEHAYIIINGEKIKATGISSTTEIFEATYPLSEKQKNEDSFTLVFESENITIPFTLEKVKSSDYPFDIGNYAQIDDMMIFANLKRDGNECEVIISQIVPDDYQFVSYEWFEHEDSLFSQGVYIIDGENRKYQLIEKDVDKNRYKNTFYFDIPADKKGLQLVIPQLLYERKLDEKLSVKLPDMGEAVMINQVYETKTHSINIVSLTYIEGESEKDDLYQRNDSQQIIMNEVSKNHDYMIRRVLPLFEVKKNIFNQFMMTSQSSYSEVWNNHEGSSISEYEDMKPNDQVKISLEVEMAYIKDIVINLD